MHTLAIIAGIAVIVAGIASAVGIAVYLAADAMQRSMDKFFDRLLEGFGE